MTNPAGENPYRRFPGHEEAPAGYPGAYPQQAAMTAAGPTSSGEQQAAPSDMFAAREAFPAPEPHAASEQPQAFEWANSGYGQANAGAAMPVSEPNVPGAGAGPSTAAMPQVDEQYLAPGQQWNAPATSGYPTPAEYSPVPHSAAAPAATEQQQKTSRPVTGSTDRNAQLRTIFHAVALVAGLIGVVTIGIDGTLEERNISLIWLVFAVLAVLVQATGAVQGPAFAKAALGAVIGLLAYWVFIMLPYVTTTAGFFVALAVGTAIAALAINPDLREAKA